jgi:type IV pilus assembly protein PilW
MMGTHATGYSLFELMLALALGLLLAIAIIQLFVSNQATYQLLNAQARLQENARVALEVIASAVRNAGYYGCAPIDGYFANALRGRGDDIIEFDVTHSVQTVRPDAPFIWFPVTGNAGLPVDVAGDILVTRTIGPPLSVVATMPPGARPVVASTETSAVIDDASIVLIADCAQAALFRVSGVATDGSLLTLAYDAGPHGDPFHNVPDATLTPAAIAYGSDAIVAPVESWFFYVAPSTTDLDASGMPVPALWLKTGARRPAELIAGVEHLDIAFGVAPAHAPPGAQQWLRYEAISQPDRIGAVRVTLTVNSVDALPGDGLLRRTFTETVNLRNPYPVSW